jgi:MerR family transcriptional regulator, light-induced transcriptional regulator
MRITKVEAGISPLREEGMRQFQSLHADAVSAVTERFYAAQGPACQHFGTRGRDACREDIAFHLQFLRPVLEFGLLQPMVDYLCWLADVLTVRAIPVDHLAVSLDLLGEFFAERMDTADGAVVAAALSAARTEFLKAKDLPVSPSGPHEPWPEVAAFEAALLAGHQCDALAVMNRCLESGRTLTEVELHVIQPSLYHIGERWQANQVSVASEHLATAIAHLVMTAGLLRSPPPPAIGKRVLLACVAGNEHAVGLRMVADAFQSSGWDVQYLGANVPSSAIVRHAAEWNVDLVGLSVSFAQQLRAAKETIAQLAERFGNARPAVIIGGLAINRFNKLAEVVGADAYSTDAPSAVACANQMAGV